MREDGKDHCTLEVDVNDKKKKMQRRRVLTCPNHKALREILNFTRWVIRHETQDMLQLINYRRMISPNVYGRCLVGNSPTSFGHRWHPSAQQRRGQRTVKKWRISFLANVRGRDSQASTRLRPQQRASSKATLEELQCLDYCVVYTPGP